MGACDAKRGDTDRWQRTASGVRLVALDTGQRLSQAAGSAERLCNASASGVRRRTRQARQCSADRRHTAPWSARAARRRRLRPPRKAASGPSATRSQKLSRYVPAVSLRPPRSFATVSRAKKFQCSIAAKNGFGAYTRYRSIPSNPTDFLIEVSLRKLFRDARVPRGRRARSPRAGFRRQDRGGIESKELSRE